MANDATPVKDAVESYEVGGVRLDRPFKIRRLGHFGFNVRKMSAAKQFYSELLGFRISDVFDLAKRIDDPEKLKEWGDDPNGYFMRHGGDHHSFVLFPKGILGTGGPGTSKKPEVTTNQITWQVASLREVMDANDYFNKHDVEVARVGRDMPGSNWHVYMYDPDGHLNEIYYGIEQVGWDGLSKPREMGKYRYQERPPVPHRPEEPEVDEAKKDGLDLTSGYRHSETLPFKYDVGGVMLPRPFKIVKIGPIRLFVDDVDVATRHYVERMGLTLTEEIRYEGRRCTFLRANTEHHSMALYPKALRAELGLSPHTSCMAFGCQVSDYTQLKAAIPFLEEHGVEIKHLPGELFPGIDYQAIAIDPDGHAVQLYYYMEQVGWDGRPRPPEARRKVSNGAWPDVVDPLPDTFEGEVYLGPFG